MGQSLSDGEILEKTEYGFTKSVFYGIIGILMYFLSL